MNYPTAYLIGIQLYNRGDYFEAHEVWEDEWNAAPAAERDFYKGLIQISVALCHFYNGNVRGASRLFHSSRALLASYHPLYLGLDLERLDDQLETCFQPVLNADGKDWIEFGDTKVPLLTLSPPPPVWPEVDVSEGLT